MSRHTIIGAAGALAFSVCLLLLTLFGDRSLPRLLWVSFAFLYVSGLSYLALWIMLDRLLGRPRGETAFVNISVALTTAVLLLVACEFAIRFAFRDVLSTGDNLSYFQKTWATTVRYNRLGFRERDFDSEKPPGTYRIAIIGDSLTFGPGIRESDRFSNLLEERLNHTRGRSYQVLNFGRSGAETTDELRFLTHPVLSTRPDFILLQWYINDVQGDDKGKAPHPVTIIPPDLRYGSALFYLAHRGLSAFQGQLGLVQDFNQYMVARFGDPGSPASRQATATMNTFIEICRKFNIPLGMVLFSESYFDPGSRLDFLLERMLGVCKEQRLRCLDTRNVFLPLQGDRKLWASRFDPHPSAFANRLVADRLLATFGDTWSR